VPEDSGFVRNRKGYSPGMPRLLSIVCGIGAMILATAAACPWCNGNPAMEPTVYESDGDPGGTYFGQVPDPQKVRRYFLAAEPVTWNYLPEGKDPMMGAPIPPHIANKSESLKYRYHQYTDASFKQRMLPTERLGIMGPVMRGVTGDFIVVTLLNRLPATVSLHPHGVRYDKDSEGSSYLPGRGKGACIAPGGRFTYVWHLDQASAPSPEEPSSKPWLYHSHVSGDEEINKGLSGFIIVTDAARARSDGTPADVDREMALLFQNYDESDISEAAEYANLPAGPSSAPGIPALPWPDLQEQRELAMRHAINGRVFGNLKGLEMTSGERIRWYLFSLGNEADVHTAHWHGARVTDIRGRSCDVVELMPGSMTSADMIADNPGDWMIHCHVGEHMMEGMYGSFSVRPPDPNAPLAEPFFGLSKQSSSTAWTAAEGDLEPAAFHLKARCKVTAHANLAAWTTPLGVKLGERLVTVTPDKTGLAKAEGSSIQVLNSDSYGVVHSDQLELELTLSGPEWAAAILPIIGGSATATLPLHVIVSGADHAAPLPLRIENRKATLAP